MSLEHLLLSRHPSQNPLSQPTLSLSSAADSREVLDTESRAVAKRKELGKVRDKGRDSALVRDTGVSLTITCWTHSYGRAADVGLAGAERYQQLTDLTLSWY